MKEYFNSQNGKPITGKQGIINHIRKKYNCDIELAYLTENNITEKPVCKCGNLAEFRNFFIGYDEECNTCRISKPNNMQMGAKSGIPIYRRFDIKEFFDFYYVAVDIIKYEKYKYI